MDNNDLQQNNNGYEVQNYKKNSNKPLILFLVLLILGLTGYIVYDKVIKENPTKNNDEATDSEKNDDDSTKTDEPVELSISGSLVTSLYDTTKTNCDFFRSFYYNAGTTLRSSIKDTDLNPSVTPGGGCPIGGTYKTKVVSAKQYSDRIEILEKHVYIAIDNNTSGTSYLIYEEKPDYTVKESVSNTIATIDESNYNDATVDKYLNNVSGYTFTFNKQSDGTYSLYSIKQEA